MKLLIVEDDEMTAQYIEKGFRENGFVVDIAYDGSEGLFLATSNEYSAIILDRMLPMLDGLACLTALRSTGNTTPVIILSALGHVDERIRGLKTGSDDYLVKPFSFQELLTRVEILINRRNQGGSAPSTTLKIDNLEMDLLAHRVLRGGQEILLQPQEFELLRCLLEHKDQVVSRTFLFEQVWEYYFDPKTNVIDVHVRNLRKKIELEGEHQLIHTVRGAGYALRLP